MAREITIKHVFISDDGYRTFSGLAWTTLLTEKQGFLHVFLQIKSFYCVSCRTQSASAFFILLIE